MSNPQFQVYYNGQPVAVTSLGNNSYLIQISYKPLRIQLKKNDDGSETWVNQEDGLECYLSSEFGSLISTHLQLAEQM
jgi:hypothetical protein